MTNDRGGALGLGGAAASAAASTLKSQKERTVRDSSGPRSSRRVGRVGEKRRARGETYR